MDKAELNAKLGYNRELLNQLSNAFDLQEDYNDYGWDKLFEICRYIYNLEQQCKKQKEVIDKAIKLIKYHERYRDGADCCQFVDIVSEILEPLQSILEQDETTNNAYLKEFEDWLKEVSE